MNRAGKPSGNGRHWVAGGGFLALALLFYAPLLLGLRTFPDGDFTHHFLPFSLYQQQALRIGQLPLWNPYTYAGHPFLADTQAAVFYPLSNLLLLLTLPWQTVSERLYFLQVEAVLHVALAGLFVYLLVNALTRRRLAAFAAGCAFAFSGYLTGYPPLQLAVLRTAIWLPLLLYLLLRAMYEPSQWRWWIGAAFAYAFAFLAGHPQTFLHISYTAAAWVFFLLLSTRRQQVNGMPKSSLAAQLLGIGSFALIALGSSCAALLPSLEFSGLSVRANVDYAYVSGGFPLQDTWQILLPGVLTQFSPLYVGVVGLALALIGLSQGRLGDREIERLTDDNLPISQSRSLPIPHFALFFAGLALIALLLSYGDNGFLYPFAYRYAPGWNLFRGQERAAFLVTLSLAVLIGAGVAALPRLGYGARRGLGLLYAMLVAGGVYFFGLFWQLMGHSAISDNRYLLLAGLTIGLALAVVVLLLLPGWSRRRTLGVIGLLVVNLFWANLTTNLDPFGPARKSILAPEMEALGQAVATDGAGDEGLVGRIYNEFRLYEDYGMRQGLEDVWGSSPLRLARYAALFDSFPLDRMWRLTGVSHVVTWRRELFEPSTLLGEFPQSTDTTYIHRLTEANPRAWLVHQIQPASDEQAVALLADHTFDLEKIALLPTDALASAVTLPSGTGQVQLAQIAAGHLQVTVDSSAGGLLILSENWMPGWQVRNVACGATRDACQVDSVNALGLSPFTVQRVDLTLIGVPVPAGVVTFELVYWPLSVQLGLWLSGGTLLVVGLLGGWHGWMRRRSRER